MTYSEIITMLTSIGIPFAYDHFAEGESPDPPFMVFLFPRSDNFGADDKVYQKINALHIELYTDAKAPDTESQIENVLDQHELFYEKTEVWIAEERLYEVLYEMEVIQNDSNS